MSIFKVIVTVSQTASEAKEAESNTAAWYILIRVCAYGRKLLPATHHLRPCHGMRLLLSTGMQMHVLKLQTLP